MNQDNPSKEELDALMWVICKGGKVECEDDEDNIINAFKALDKLYEMENQGGKVQ